MRARLTLPPPFLLILIAVVGAGGLAIGFALDRSGRSIRAPAPEQPVVAARFAEAVPEGAVLVDETAASIEGAVTTVIAARFNDRRQPEELVRDLRARLLEGLETRGEETSDLGEPGSRLSFVYIVDGDPVWGMLNIAKMADGEQGSLYLVTLTTVQ